MKEYERAEIEIIIFDGEDIVATSDWETPVNGG